jgi:RHS repeat-associated protein
MLGQTIEQRQPGHDNTELVTTMAYNSKGQLEKTTPPVGPATYYDYNPLGQQIRTWQDINGNNTLDLAGPDRITESDVSHESDGSDYWRITRSHTYDHGSDQPLLVSTTKQRLTGLGTPHPDDPALGLLVAESRSIDIHGNQSISRRYINRDLQTVWTEQHSPFSDTKATTLTVGGLLLEQTDTHGITTTYDYDELQRRIASHQILTELQEDPENPPEMIEVEIRRISQYIDYNEPEPNEPHRGLVYAISDAAGNTTTFEYDTTGRQIAVTDPEGYTTHTAFTLRGQVAATWGATYPVVYEYDTQGRMIHLHTLRDPENEIVFNPTVDDNGVLDMDSLDHLLNPQDPQEPQHTVMDTTTWVYEDSTGLLLEKLYADNKGPTYTYTPDGRLLTRTWARNPAVPAGNPAGNPPADPLTTTYHYDSDTLELTQITYSDDTPSVTNTYDRLGRLVSTTDAFGTKTYTYDPATLQPLTESWDGLVETTLTRAYDNQGRPTGFSLGAAHTVTYTDTGRFHAVTVSNALDPSPHDPITATYTYTPNSPLISGYTLGDLTRTVTYENNRNLIDTVANTWDTTLISQFDYTNDKAGRRTDREDSGTAFASTQNNTFSYNDRNEVTNATMRNGTSTYNFDQIGNRVQVTTPDEPNSLFYLTNALNQYLAIEESVPPSVPVRAYDADGNLTNDGEGTTFKWNAENRMVRVEKGNIVMLNTYDGQGRRVRKHVFDNGNPVEDTRFFYDGWNLIYEIDVLAADPEPTFYVWGLDLSQSLQGAGGVGGLLLVLTPNSELPATAHAVSYDANGNISEYINLANGNVDAHLEYDAFGRIIASTGTAPSNFGFSTKYEDTETGYLYYGFRYYDPQTGRWPNRDPIGERGGLNLYAFVGNNGVNTWDYLGLKRSKFFDIARLILALLNPFNPPDPGPSPIDPNTPPTIEPHNPDIPYQEPFDIPSPGKNPKEFNPDSPFDNIPGYDGDNIPPDSPSAPLLSRAGKIVGSTVALMWPLPIAGETWTTVTCVVYNSTISEDRRICSYSCTGIGVDQFTYEESIPCEQQCRSMYTYEHFIR